MFFKSLGHKSRFVRWIQHIEKVYKGRIDSEYGAALYILSADEEIWSKATDYIFRNAIHFEKMLNEVDLSSGYTTLVKLARDLFTSAHNDDDPFHIIGFMNLDSGNFQVAMQALMIRYSSPLLADIENEQETT